MIKREVEKEIIASLKVFPAVILLGARQVGKTTLSRHIKTKLKRKAIYFDLENPSDFEKLSGDSKFFLEQHKDSTVVIDEVQRLPELFPLIRYLIDKKKINGRFILLGSAGKNILESASESLAGRAKYIEMNPIFYSEISSTKFQHHFLTGGFPKAFLAKGPKQFKEWFDGFVSSYVERDLKMMGLNANPITIRRLITMLAGVNGAVINYSMIANSLGITGPTVKTYMYFLESAFILRTVQPYFPNLGKRLTKASKIYFRDTGLLNYFLGIYDKKSLYNSAYLGSVFESYIMQQIIPKLNYRTSAYFYRTHAGSEMDLCLVQGNKVKLALEIRFSTNPVLSKGNHIAVEDLGKPDLAIISPLAETFQKNKKTFIVNIKDLEKYLRYYDVIN